MTTAAALALSLYLLDWNQTLTISSMCANPGALKESNLLLGRCPSKEAVNTYFAGVLITHLALNTFLPKELAQWYNFVSISVESMTITNNYALGIHIKF